jgi:hypothetical protein
MSGHYNSGENHNVNINDKSFEHSSGLRYFGTTIKQIEITFIRKVRAHKIRAMLATVSIRKGCLLVCCLNLSV